MAGGVAAADQNDVFVAAHARLDRGNPIPHAAALEFFEMRDLGPAIACTGGDHHGRRLDPPAIRQFHGQGPPVAIEPRDLAGDHHLGAELLRLYEGATR